MNTKRFTIGLAIVLACATNAATAATLYWSGNGTTQGGVGTWDTTLTRWGTVPAGPFSSVWNNGNLDTGNFGGTAGVVTLGATIDVGGLQFNTTGYGITSTGFSLDFEDTNNPILFNNIAAATITGPVGGIGNVSLTGGNTNTAGTLTLNGASTGGWSGTTTINSGMTMSLAAANQGLNTTTGITLNGGGITLTNTSATAITNNRVNDSAAITSNGGTFTYTNTSGASVYAETIGSVALTSGQLNFNLATNQASTGSQTLTLSGLTRTGASNSSAVTFSAATTAPNATKNMILVSGASATPAGQIIGPWATTGTAAGSQNDYAVYDASGFVLPANIAGSAETTWTTAANAYTNALAAQTLTGTRTITALRNTGTSTVLTLATGNNLETYGVLNGAATLLTIAPGTGGVLTTPTGGGNLYLTTHGLGTNNTGAHNGINITAPINDNGGAVTLVKSGPGVLQLNATSNYSGGTVLNSGTLWAQSDASLGNVNGDITFNGSATLLIATSNGTGGTFFTLPATRSIIVNNGAMATIAGGRANANPGTINSDISGTGGVTVGRVALLNSGGVGNYNFALLGTNTFTGALNVGTGLDTAAGAGNNGLRINTLADSTSPITLNFGSFGFFDLASTAPANLSVPNRPVDLRNSNLTINNLSATRTMTLGSVSTTTAGAKTLNVGAGGAGGFISGAITNGAGTIGVTKSSSGTWTVSGTSNTFTGAITLNSTTVSAGALTFASAGGANAITFLQTTGSATLSYTGSGQTMSGAITASALTSGTITLDASGTGAINYSNTGSLGSAGSLNKNLILSGTNTGNNTLAGQWVNNTGGAARLTKSGAGKWVLTNTNSYTGATTISAGTLQLGNGGITGALTGTASITGNGSLIISRSNDFTQATDLNNRVIGGNGFFTQAGAGNTTLSLVNTYTGATNVNAGTLAVSGTGTINATSAINVAAGARFAYNSSVALAVAPTLSGNGTGSRAIYGGTGTLNAALTLDNVGDVLSPGNSPGVQSYIVNQSWASNSYDWELNDWIASVAGTNIDQIQITGNLTLMGAAPGSYILNVLSLTSGNLTGDVANFSDVDNSWTILTTTTGISGFNASFWTVDATGFTSNPVATGSWNVAQSDNNLILNYVAVPEPATIAIVGSAVGLLGLRLARRRKA